LLPVKIASWNVNSIRVRLPHVLDWLRQQQPDVLGLQEIKLTTDNFPRSEFTDLGYHVIVNGQKTYNGVALLSTIEPVDIKEGIPGYEDEQKRVIAATYGDTRIIDVYVPNGQTVGSDKYAYKLEWLAALENYLKAELKRYPKLAIMGDFNIAPDDRDVHDPEEWRGKVLCSDAERAAFQTLLALGIQDAFRLLEQPEHAFSWWDYRAAAFRRKRGMRIDLILVSDLLAPFCSASAIDEEPRKLERPSDHAPVYTVLRS